MPKFAVRLYQEIHFTRTVEAKDHLEAAGKVADALDSEKVDKLLRGVADTGDWEPRYISVDALEKDSGEPTGDTKEFLDKGGVVEDL